MAPAVQGTTPRNPFWGSCVKGNRAPEAAALFNPAYCAVILNAAATGYAERSGTGMPFSLSFIVMPMIVHELSRNSLPGTSAGKFSNWILDSKHVLLGFPDRARRMAPYTREAVRFGIASDTLELVNGQIKPSLKIATRASALNGTVSDAYKQARKLGMMLASGGSPGTIYALLGVAP